MIELLNYTEFNLPSVWFDPESNISIVGDNPNHADSWVFGYDDTQLIIGATISQLATLVYCWINQDSINVLQYCGIE